MTEKHYEEITLDPGSVELPPMDFLRDCPACGAQNSSSREDCETCGIVFTKWREPRSLSMRGMGDARTQPSIDWGGVAQRIIPLLVLAGVGFAVWFFVLRAHYMIVGPAIGQGEKTVILMHGFAVPGDDLERRAQALSVRLPQITWVLPPAPHSARGGRAWVIGPSEEDVRASAKESTDAIRTLLAEVIKDGVDPSTLYLAGYSQGAKLALHVALDPRSPEFGGLILLSGGIPTWPGARSLKADALPPDTSVFIAHGRKDAIVSIRQAARIHAQLTEARVPVEFFTAKGGHRIDPAAIDALVEWLGGDTAP